LNGDHDTAGRGAFGGFAQGWGFLVSTDPIDLFARHTTSQVLAVRAEPDKGWQDNAEAKWPTPFEHRQAVN
jgi:hypothetical protein